MDRLPRQSDFARQLGFGSYLELFEASTLVSSRAGKNWYVTSDRGHWIAWNDHDLTAQERRGPLEEAISRIEGWD